MTEQHISTNQLKSLRDQGFIAKDEIAFFSGDLVIAENVLTGQKRVLGDRNILEENSKRLLKG